MVGCLWSSDDSPVSEPLRGSIALATALILPWCLAGDKRYGPQNKGYGPTLSRAPSRPESCRSDRLSSQPCGPARLTTWRVCAAGHSGASFMSPPETEFTGQTGLRADSPYPPCCRPAALFRQPVPPHLAFSLRTGYDGESLVLSRWVLFGNRRARHRCLVSCLASLSLLPSRPEPVSGVTAAGGISRPSA